MPTTFTHSRLTSTAAIAALVDAGFVLGAPRRSERTVLDTFDGRLNRAGLRLELRSGTAPELVLVDLSDPAAPPARLPWGSSPRWPAELSEGPLRARIQAITKERALLPQLALHSVVREGSTGDRRGRVARVEVHEQIDTGADAAPRWAVELVPVDGATSGAKAAEALDAIGLDCTAGDLVSVLASAAGRSLAGWSGSPSVPLAPGQDVLQAHRLVLANLLGAIEVNLPGAIEDIDPEFLHDLRVAVRRTRSVLDRAKGVVPDPVRDTFRPAFKELGAVTTPPRDLDVYDLGWDAYVAPLGGDGARALEPVREEIRRQRAAAHEEASRLLAGPATRDVLDRWQAWLDDPGVVSEPSRPVGPVVARRIRKLEKTLLREGRAITDDAPAEALHHLRKSAKKLRYMLECFGTLLDAKPTKSFVRQLKALQDNLGDHQDAEVHLAQIHDLAVTLHRQGVAPEVLLGMGRLAEHLDQRRRRDREEFAERFARYDSKANARLLRVALAPAEAGPGS